MLKGGAALEFRLLDKARSTKDIDLAVRIDDADGEVLREALVESLSADPDEDGFSFQTSSPVPLAADAAGRGAWRFSVEARLAGKPFASVRLDAAARGVELTSTEQLRMPGALSFAEIPARTVEAVTTRQHFAEKLHALTRDYEGRPNTRTKDLADLVLLIELGLSPDRELVDAVRHVFAVRDTHPVPDTIPDPPPAWESGYPAIATNLTETPPDLAVAMRVLREFWATAMVSDI
ncbi:hypothetical protein GCM10022247_45120 [Allokutzneria multivorans]|uniref:Nucleotidyl transferase AbiEii/AbiGii toxin family protein n=1 Tax=Allokutzneria multivorans TaxID=1142134 RepID=A0ABP7SV11_9PSEU